MRERESGGIMSHSSAASRSRSEIGSRANGLAQSFIAGPTGCLRADFD